MDTRSNLSRIAILIIAIILTASVAVLTAQAQVSYQIIVIPTSGLVTDENGGMDTFTIALSSQPTSPVKIDLSSSDSTEGTVSPASVNLSPGNWDSPQTVTVTGIPDGLQDGDVAYTILTSPAISNDVNYNGIDAPDVAVTNQEDAKPLASDDSAATDEDTPIAIDVLANDSALNDTPLTLTILTNPANGAATIGAANSVSYSPNQNFNGEDAFQYQVCDVDVDCSQAIVSLIIAAINDPPTTVNDTASTTSNFPIPIDVLVNDSDVEGDTLLLDSFDSTSTFGGTVTRLDAGTPQDLSDDQLNYLPATDFYGEDTFTYFASDSSQASGATVTVTVGSGAMAPIAVNDSYQVGQKEILQVPAPGVLQNDTDPNGDLLTAILKDKPLYGDLVLNADGSLIYTPNGDFVGLDTFTYSAGDGLLNSSPATVEITILDQLAPSVNWISPVGNDQVYVTRLEIVLLEVEAADNVNVDQVYFYRWDANIEQFIDIDRIFVAPFRVYLDTRMLNPVWNQIFARAYDGAGNVSVRQSIWIYRTSVVFLPVVSYR